MKEIRLKEKKSKFPIFVVAVISFFLLISVVLVIIKTQPFVFEEKFTIQSEVQAKPVISKEIEAAKDISNFFEILKNQNKAMKINPTLEFGYQGIPAELNEYPIYKTCDNRLMPNNVNPFATYSWMLLAYASLYDSLKDESYILKIRETEGKLYDIYELIKIGDGIPTNVNRAYYDNIILMYHVLDNAYSIVKGKSVLLDESKFENIIREGSFEFYDFSNQVHEIQPVAMISMSLSDASKYFQGGENKEYVLGLADNFRSRSIELSDVESSNNKPAQFCWVKQVEYEYNFASGRSNQNINSFFKDLDISMINDDEFMPGYIHPCIEVLNDIYEETGDVSYLQKARELNEKILERFAVKGATCELGSAYAIRSGIGETADVYFISDNAFELYLTTRLELK